MIRASDLEEVEFTDPATVRLIPTAYIDEPTMVLLADNEDDLAILEEIEGLTSARLSLMLPVPGGLNPVELLTEADGFGWTYVDAAFCCTRTNGNRFNAPDRGAWYASHGDSAIETAQTEVAWHLTRELEATGVFENTTSYRELIAGFTSRFYDLNGLAGNDAINPDPSVAYPVGQTLARDALVPAGMDCSTRRQGTMQDSVWSRCGLIWFKMSDKVKLGTLFGQRTLILEFQEPCHEAYQMKASTHMIYLDGFSSWPIRPEAKATLIKALSLPGNSNSNHVAGWQANEHFENGKRETADLIGANSTELVVTSGATESNALALLGVARAAASKSRSRNKIVVSTIEHDAIGRPMELLRAEGFEIAECPVGADGSILLGHLANVVDERTILVSTMMANNLTGQIQPIENISKIAHDVGALMHTDAAQAAGKILIDVFDLDVDYLSLSAHKFGGPQGVGALYVGSHALKPVELTSSLPITENLSGTHPAGLVASMGKAAAICRGSMLDEQNYSDELLSRFERGLRQAEIKVDRIFSKTKSVPGGAAFVFEDFSTSDLISSVAGNLCMSNASACHSGQLQASPVLSAMHIPAGDQYGFLRVGVGWWLSTEDIDIAVNRISAAFERQRTATGACHQ